jgi:peptidyl-dipeptidase Dcp
VNGQRGEDSVGKSPDAREVTVRTGFGPGDLGYVIHMHGRLYALEYGYGVPFEMYVAAGMRELYEGYDGDRDVVWLCEHRGRIVGSLFLEHRESHAAQLRYFLIEPEYRGIGLGKKLLGLYMSALVQRGYRSSYLWTTHELTAAAALYRRFGFELTEEKESAAFGKPLVEQRYDLRPGVLHRLRTE